MDLFKLPILNIGGNGKHFVRTLKNQQLKQIKSELNNNEVNKMQQVIEHLERQKFRNSKPRKWED